MPKRARVSLGFVVLATLVVTCLFTLASLGRPGAPQFTVLHNRELLSWVIWIAATPLIITAARRFPFGEGSPLHWLGTHLLLGLGFAGLSTAIGYGARAAMGMSGNGTGPVSGIASGMLIYALIAVAYQAVSYHRTAREREAVAARLRADLAEARLAGIEGKLQPHFLFNALNSIAALLREDPRLAETMIEHLGELLHATLRSNPTDEVPLAEALHLAEQYLAIERVRFQERLRTSIQVSDAALKGMVPPLLLQPLVENAIRHGLAHLVGGGTVYLTAAVEHETLRITVEDDGVGFGKGVATHGTGLGLSSVRSTLSHLYGIAQRVDVLERLPRGTIVTIALPYRPVMPT